MNKIKSYWYLQIGGWLIFALVQIIGFLILGNQQISTSQIFFWLIEASLFLLFTHIFRLFIIKRGWLGMSMVRLIPRILIAVMLIGVVLYFARLLTSIPLGIYNPNVALSLANIIGLSFVFAVILFIWSVLYFIYHYFEQYNISLKHEAAIHEIELNNLKSQLNPHFIFNALNSIRALVDENPQKSKNSITQLSSILRNSLVTDKKRLTTFNDELRTVKDYLGLETIRFEERLKTEFDIQIGSNDFKVPPLMLQTLVENGVKHGISQLKEGGFIKLKTFAVGDHLKIIIQNSGHYNEMKNGKSKDKVGLGIKNTRQRLNLLYRGEASLKIYNSSSNTVTTELIIPKNDHI